MAKRSTALRIAFVSSECVPFAKTGGLADVVGTLPVWIKSLQQDISIFLPRYRIINPHEYGFTSIDGQMDIPLGRTTVSCTAWKGKTKNGIPIYCIEYKPFFDREYLYGSSEGDYADNDERFIVFNRAVLELMRRLDLRPDIVHCHDWQTGLVPLLMRADENYRAYFEKTRSVFTIHNIAYQGIFHRDSFYKLNIPADYFSMSGIEYYGHVCFLKSGIVFSDYITTVSSTYAQEIQSGRVFGCGMEGILHANKDRIEGIINGIDYDEWNPRTDPLIPRSYHPPSR
ncbi:MAG: glycogen synthase, partial [Elusimicrobia bacterium]|nr:glycogen synthase [Elusimicrobiota bacterium]